MCGGIFSVVIGSQNLPGFQGIAEQKRTKSGTFSMGILLASLPATGFMKFRNEEFPKILIIAIYRSTNGAMTILQPKLTPYPHHVYQRGTQRVWSQNAGSVRLAYLNLRIYDTPRDLGEFIGLRTMKNGFELRELDRPPQSWCYVTEMPEVANE